MADVHIRLAQPGDIPALLAITQQSPEASQWSMHQHLHAVAALDGTEECLVAVEAGTVAGFIVTRTISDECEILNLAVAPQRRRQKIASALLQGSLAASAKAGAGRVFLEVRESNRAAYAFYMRHGFAEGGRRRGYYSEPVEDALVLSRPLPSRP